MTPQFKFPKVFSAPASSPVTSSRVTEVFMKKKTDMSLPQTLSDDLSLENVRSCKYDHDK